MIYEIIKADIIKSMKDKTKFVTETLRCLDSDIQLKALNTKKPITDDLVLDVIAKCIKQRNDSVEIYTKHNRVNAAQKELSEIYIMQKYQPEQLTEDKVKQIIEATIELTGYTDLKDMGKLMKEVNQQVKGKADGKLVAELVKNVLKGE